MSKPSSWQLKPGAKRIILTQNELNYYKDNPLCSGLYPTAVGYYPVASGHYMNRKIHDDWLFLYCISGKGRLSIDSVSYEVQPGDLIVLPFGLAHAYKSCENEPWSIYWTHFEGDLSPCFINEIPSDQIPVFPIGISSDFVSDWHEMLSIIEEGHDHSRLIRLAGMFRKIITYIVTTRQRQALYSSLLDPDKIIQYFEQHIHNSICLEDLAAEFNMSKYHFLHTFRGMFGMPPIKYFLMMKMKHACNLLNSTSLCIKEISVHLGYENQLYFSRLFKQNIGYSPKHYRSLYKG